MNNNTYPMDVPDIGDRVVLNSGPERLLQRPAVVLTVATAITPGGLRPYATIQFTHNDEILMAPVADMELAPVVSLEEK